MKRMMVFAARCAAACSLLLFIIALSGPVIGQTETCSAFVLDALASVDAGCAATGRNQACYGNTALVATPREGVAEFQFAAAGDLVNVAAIDSLTLRQFDEEAGEWGIALMRLQANLPDSLPGQNVTFILFGDVQVQNAVDPAEPVTTIEVVSSGNINVRTGPSTDFRVASSLSTGATLIANGRNADGTWLRVQVPDADEPGWVFADLITTEADVSTLAVVEAGDAAPLTPMQAFYFSTGITGTACEAVPQSGILIQTPEGAGEITFRANDVDISLGSSAYFQAQAGESMVVSVIEGQGEFTADGETVTVPAGAQVAIPLDADLSASGPPSEPVPYDEAGLQTLPVSLLPETITVAPPIDPDDLVQQSSSGGSSGGMAGMGGFDPSLMGLDMATFCSIITQGMAESGMSIADYIALMESMSGMMPAESQADYQAFLALLRQC